MVMAEVHNTFGERHPYWLDPSIETLTPSGRHDDFDKAFLARHPWMTGKVIAAIHWQAPWLRARGLPVFTHPKKLARKEAS
jgi:DUF1365 family protein